MKAIPSSTFRRTYATLTEPVAVTVHGHVIGTWEPVKRALSKGSRGDTDAVHLSRRLPPD